MLSGALNQTIPKYTESDRMYFLVLMLTWLKAR